MNTIPYSTSAIRFATFLSPNLYGLYEYIARYISERVECPTTLTVGQSLEEIAAGQIDVAFMCGLQYIQLISQLSCSVELLVAPVLQGERYQHKPMYFSDVIVSNDSPYTSFDDLRGCTWGYNQKTSHSGYNLVCYNLLEHGKSLSYFGTTLETGSHLHSIKMVLEKRIDATAVDSHILDVFLSQKSDFAARLRVIDMLGPSSIPPIVVSQKLDNGLKRIIQDALLTMHHDPLAARQLHDGAIERFLHVTDEDYDDIRRMLIQVERKAFSLYKGTLSI